MNEIHFGTITAEYSDGKTKVVHWVDAAESALRDEISAVRSESPIDAPVIEMINQAIL